MNETSSPDPLIFKLSDDGKLLAVFEACETSAMLDELLLKEILVQQGFAELFFYKNALSNLLKQYNTPNEGFVLEIGERRDGEFTINIDVVKMSARLTLVAPYGGVPVTLDQIQLALQEKGVVSGILINEIHAALKECLGIDAEDRSRPGAVVERIIAKGLAAVPGIDARFQSLIPQIRDRKPQVDKNGVADYRDLGSLVVVNPGDPLMCRTPPTEGKKGRDITGQVLMPQPGLDTQFTSGLQGVEFDLDAELDPDNNSLLLAAITGQPKLVLNGIMVEPTINLPVVSLSTGNMSFDGTINIKGDVKEGMKVYATGDVFVGGTVEAAEIIAGGNVVIKGGVIGRSEQSGDSNKAPVFNAKISSKGSISARFAENVCMEAGIDIIISEFSMHNHLTALNRILVGKSGAKKGQIIGGIASASVLVKTGTIGASSGLITKIKAGLDPYLQVEMDKLTLEIEANEKEQEDIKKIITFIITHPEKDKKGLLDKLLHTREKLVADCPQLHAERTRLLSQMTVPEDVKVIVEEAVHCGAEIQLGHAIWKNNDKRGKGIFQTIGGKIEFGNMMMNIS